MEYLILIATGIFALWVFITAHNNSKARNKIMDNIRKLEQRDIMDKRK